MKRLLLIFGIVSCWTTLSAQKPNIAPAATVTADGTGGFVEKKANFNNL